MDTLEDRKVGDLTCSELVGVLMYVHNQRASKGDPRLQELTIKEFTELMLSQMQEKAFKITVAENEQAQRVTTDWRGLSAVEAWTMPYRLKSLADVDKHANDLRQYFTEYGVPGGGRGEIVVVVGVSSSPGVYTRLGG